MAMDNGLYRNPGGRMWLYHFKFKGQTYKGSTGHKSKTMARDWLDKFRERLANTVEGFASPEAPPVEKLWKAWLEEHSTTASSRHVDRVTRDWDLHILPALRGIPVDQVNTERVMTLRRRYLEGESLRNRHQPKPPPREGEQSVPTRKRSTIGANRLVAHLHLVLGWCVKVGKIPHVPFRLERLQEQDPVRHVLRLEQVGPFLEALDRITVAGATKKAGKKGKRPGDALPVRIAVRAMLWLALREDEALHLRWSGFSADFRDYTPELTKTGKGTALPVPEELRQLLAIQRTRVDDGCTWVLPAEDGEPHRQQFTRKAIQAAGADIGAPGLSPHRMRGTAATLLARAGVSAFGIMRVGRWARIETAQKYVHLAADDVREALDLAFSRGVTVELPEKKSKRQTLKKNGLKDGERVS